MTWTYVVLISSMKGRAAEHPAQRIFAGQLAKKHDRMYFNKDSNAFL